MKEPLFFIGALIQSLYVKIALELRANLEFILSLLHQISTYQMHKLLTGFIT